MTRLFFRKLKDSVWLWGCVLDWQWFHCHFGFLAITMTVSMTQGFQNFPSVPILVHHRLDIFGWQNLSMWYIYNTQPCYNLWYQHSPWPSDWSFEALGAGPSPMTAFSEIKVGHRQWSPDMIRIKCCKYYMQIHIPRWLPRRRRRHSRQLSQSQGQTTRRQAPFFKVTIKDRNDLPDDTVIVSTPDTFVSGVSKLWFTHLFFSFCLPDPHEKWLYHQLADCGH